MLVGAEVPVHIEKDWDDYQQAASKLNQMSPNAFTELVLLSHDLYKRIGIGFSGSQVLTLQEGTKGKLRDAMQLLKENVPDNPAALPGVKQVIKKFDTKSYESHVPTPVASIVG